MGQNRMKRSGILSHFSFPFVMKTVQKKELNKIKDSEVKSEESY